jgi:hypothetical protein
MSADMTDKMTLPDWIDERDQLRYEKQLVVRERDELRAEIERLREELTLSEAMYRQAGVTAERENQRLRAERDAEAARYDEVLDTLKAVRSDHERALSEIERLREVLARLVELGHDDGGEPEDAWTVAWGHAESVLGPHD